MFSEVESNRKGITMKKVSDGEWSTYLVRFKPNNGFSGWNTVGASSLKEAKKAFKKLLGESLYKEILWPSLLIGEEAARESDRIESQWGSAFW